MKYLLTILFLTTFSILTHSQSLNNLISVDIKHQVLKKGKLFTAESQTMYNGLNQEITFHYITPTEFYKTINSKGEITIYMPKENTVSFSHNNHYSSKNELLYYFVTNTVDDLGLKNEGFTVKSSKYENDNLIVTWQAPVGFKSINEVDIVFENMIPIYSEYRSIKGNVIKKIYYYEYYIGNYFNIPQKITEISYIPNDSIVKRTSFSNIKIGSKVDERIYKFNIPENATKIE